MTTYCEYFVCAPSAPLAATEGRLATSRVLIQPADIGAVDHARRRLSCADVDGERAELVAPVRAGVDAWACSGARLWLLW